MQTITFISTIHKELGNCNSDELCIILERVRPDVIFLEALEDTYSTYQQYIFDQFGGYHRKLELAAIQKYSKRFIVVYVPVLEKGLPDSFDCKYNKLKPSIELRSLLADQNSRISEGGFNYLNSKECSVLNDKMRELERHLLNDSELEKLFCEDIDEYENTMMQNIYLYSRSNLFSSAVFMCGVAHRNSIIAKMESFNTKEKLNLNWKILGT